MDLIFRVSNLLVLPFWAGMIFLPRRRWTERFLRSPLVVLAPAMMYAALVLPRVGAIFPVVLQPTLSSVAALLSSADGASIAWVHFLAFDLFVGRWMYLDSRERDLSPWMMAPVLFLTLMLGPAGFLSYLLVRFLAAQAGSVPTRSLTIMGWVMAMTLLATIAGIFLDPRIITGAPAWVKPAKFAISVSIYCFTLVWMLGFIKGRPRFVRNVVNLITISLAGEMIAIIGQAARGTTSHFNMSTPFDAAVWDSMGAFITLLWVVNLAAAIALLKQRIPDEAFAWSLRLGVFISLAGMAEAFVMAAFGAHSVGVPDGGPGIPLLGWSTAGGDLRIAHFVGIHAMQVMPLLGWVVSRLKVREGVALVWCGGASYLGLVVLLLWQALRGQSLIHPDGLTLAAAVIVVVAPVLLWRLRWNRVHESAIECVVE